MLTKHIQSEVSHRYEEYYKKECCMVFLPIRSANFSVDQWKKIRTKAILWISRIWKPTFICSFFSVSLAVNLYVTRFLKISLNVTFYNQNEERELPINLKVCSSHLKLSENNWKYFEKSCNTFAVVTINCVILCIQCDIKTDFPKSGHIFWLYLLLRLHV